MRTPPSLENNVVNDARKHIVVIWAAWLREMRRLREYLSRHARVFVPTLSPLGPMPDGIMRYIGLGITLIAMALFVVIFAAYTYQLHNTLGTHAEDLGIMDQVLWNTAHGHFWQETICNSISDTNCLVGTSRWAIHFEPLMLALVPLYWIIPGPHMLQFVQVAGASLGALPAYWLGSRRFQNVAAGVVVANVYLLLPAIRTAIVDDFHMVSLAAPLLMFAIYFLYARQDRAFIIACILAMGTKEQIPIDVFMLGVAAVLLQRRWRLGLIVMAMAVAWALLALGVLHLASAIGASPTAGRYNGIVGTLQRFPLLWQDAQHRYYIRTLIGNTGGLALLAPWTLALAAPSALLNALSSSSNQYSGMYQYNADIAPLLLMAAIEGFATIQLGASLLARGVRHMMKLPRRQLPLLRQGIMVLIAVWAITTLPVTSQIHMVDPNDPLTPWPVASAHTQEAQSFFNQIPPQASLSAQGDLTPHLSERPDIYQFPDGVKRAQYVLIDMESPFFYPEPNKIAYIDDVEAMLYSGDFKLIDTQDGFILLKRRVAGDPAQPIVLPQDRFCQTRYLIDQLAVEGMRMLDGCVNPPAG
jgi:uncharacterized membrane protein